MTAIFENSQFLLGAAIVVTLQGAKNPSYAFPNSLFFSHKTAHMIIIIPTTYYG